MLFAPLLPLFSRSVRLAPYFDQSIPTVVHKRRQQQVVRHMYETLSGVLRDELIGEQERAFKITPQRLVTRCERTLGDTVFACYPTSWRSGAEGEVVRFPKAEPLLAPTPRQ